MVREAVFGHVVVIPGLRNKPVADDSHSGWRVERAGGDADRFIPWRVPEETGATLAAETSPGSGVTVRTLEPAKATLLQQQQIRSCHRAGCRHVPVPAAALLTVAKQYVGERPSNSVANGSTQALPRRHLRRHDTVADQNSALDGSRASERFRRAARSRSPFRRCARSTRPRRSPRAGAQRAPRQAGSSGPRPPTR